MLAIIPDTARMDGTSREKPSLYFNPTAHAVSNNPATHSKTQAMEPPFECPGSIAQGHAWTRGIPARMTLVRLQHRSDQAGSELCLDVYTIPAATWPRSCSRLSSVLAQASATSTPLVAKCLRKNSKCAALSWNCCGVSTAENTGTSVRNCTSISARITASATYSSSITSPAATIAV